MVRSVPDNVKPQTVLFSTEAPLPAAFLTLSLSASHYYNLGGVRGARSRDSLSVLPASNGLQRAKPQSFVRIVASMLTRVM